MGLLSYVAIAAGLFGLGFGSGFYFQGLRWDAAVKEQLEAHALQLDEVHQRQLAAKQLEIEQRKGEVRAIERALARKTGELKKARAKAEAINAEYEALKRSSEEVSDWADQPVPHAVCRLLDGASCRDGGDGAPGKMPPPSVPAGGERAARLSAANER